MQETIPLQPQSDDPLVSSLRDELGFDVECCDAADPLVSEILISIIDAPDKAVVKTCGDHATVAICLPSGKLAVWKTPLEFANQSARHASTFVASQQMQRENEALSNENEALAIQVADDFEGLSLVRSLAACLELPADRRSIPEGVRRFLHPLTTGVCAESIAAVFLGDDELEWQTPFWSGAELIPVVALQDLIGQHMGEATRHPVVRNDRDQFPAGIAAEEIRELILVQVRSEGRLHGWLLACNRVDAAHQDASWEQTGFSTIQASLLETAANQLAAQLHNFQLLRQREELFTDVVRALVNAVEARDPYTSGHSERVARFAQCLALAGGESEAGCERIYLTGLLHDVGKIAIPDGVLRKPGGLNDAERRIIETHTDAGWRILHELDALRDVLPGVLYHHERFDGKGYPDGLIGENIPLDGRILAVCDAFDAMTSSRPYRTGMSTQDAVDIMQKGAGTYWDPKIVTLFMENIESIDEIRRSHRPRPQVTRPAPVDGKPSLDPIPVPTE